MIFEVCFYLFNFYYQTFFIKKNFNENMYILLYFEQGLFLIYNYFPYLYYLIK